MVPNATLLLVQNLGSGVWLLVIAVALLRGGRPERVAAVALLLDLAAVELFRGFDHPRGVQWRNLAGDGVVLAVLIAVAATSKRRWLPWAVGVQIAAVLVHVPRMIHPGVRNVSYGTLAAVLGYGVIAVLLWGALTEAKHAPDA